VLDASESITEGVKDPSVKAQIRGVQHILDTARARLDKRREEYRRTADTAQNGPRGENRSAILAERVELVELEQIVDDPNFANLRLQVEEKELRELSESMRHEGLKVPITLIAISENSLQFYIRAGFRRTKVARQLGWKKIPAVILPHNTPTVEEYWTNIIENSARSRLHSYEIACASRIMRDRFHITPRDFAVRAGYSESYVHNLLRCLDRLPDPVLDAWRTKSPIPVDLYIKWSIMEPSEAVKMMMSYAGRNPQVVKDWQPPTKRQRPLLIKMASTRGLQRMQQARFAFSVSRLLNEPTRALCLYLIDFCSGGRDDVPGIYNPRQKQHMYQSRRKRDLKPLDLEELGKIPLSPSLNQDDDNKDKS
jgi:ParB/RepB/Spo0J family partition protein